MVRRVLKKKRFRYDDARNQTRHDQNHFDWLVHNGFFAKVADGWFTLTDKGKALGPVLKALYGWGEQYG